jgi:hypothetical protein
MNHPPSTPAGQTNMNINPSTAARASLAHFLTRDGERGFAVDVQADNMKDEDIELKNQAICPEGNRRFGPARLALEPAGGVELAPAQVWWRQRYEYVGSREHSLLDD